MRKTSILLIFIIVLGIFTGCKGEMLIENINKTMPSVTQSAAETSDPTEMPETSESYAPSDVLEDSQNPNPEPPYMTVAELEDAINGYFKDVGIALECAFLIQDRWEYSSEIQSFGTSTDTGSVYWKLKFHFTSWDDPNTPYPDVEQLTEYIDPEAKEKQWCYEYIPLSLDILAKGTAHDAPVYKVNFWPGELTSEIIFGSTVVVGSVIYDDKWQTYQEDLQDIICNLWSTETNDDSLSAFLRGERTELDPLCKKVDGCEVENISGFYETNTTYCYGLEQYPLGINFLYLPLCTQEVHDPVNLMDPSLLDCPYSLNDAIRWGEVPDQDYLEGSNKIYPYSEWTNTSGILDLLDEYLRTSGSKVVLGDYIYLFTPNGSVNQFGNRDISAHYYDFKIDQSGSADVETLDIHLDSRSLGMFWIDDQTGFVDELYYYAGAFGYGGVLGISRISNADMYMLFYNEKVDYPVEYEYILRIPIGMSQIYDEGMTTEEAVALHTAEQEVISTYGDWQISMYAPRNVVHVICKNPNSGQVLYCAVPKAIFDTRYGTIDQFVSHPETISMYESFLENGYLDPAYVYNSEECDTGMRYPVNVDDYARDQNTSPFFEYRSEYE